MGATIYAGSVDTLEQAHEVAANGFTFPIAYGVTIEESDTFGVWPATDHHGTYLQPSEFLLGRGAELDICLLAGGPHGCRRSVDVYHQP